MKNNYGLLCLYDIKKVKELFENNKVIAYGNGSLFNKIKEYLDLFDLKFFDVLYTENEKTIAKSGRLYNDISSNSIILICSSFHKEINNILNNQKIKPKDIQVAIFSNSTEEKLNIYKKELAKVMQIRHKRFLQNLKGKEKIRVVFLVLLESVWKIDSVFKKMLEDQYFEPLILVIPYTSNYAKDSMYENMEKTYEYFVQKGYPTILSYNKKENRWITLNELDIDIVFFTVPHNLTRKEYYENAYLNYLSCYTGYGVNVAALRNLIQFNQIFHNVQWINFANSQFVFECYQKYSAIQGKNAILVGDITCEKLLDNDTKTCIWENNDKRIKMIYAPHHSIVIDEKYCYGLSTFLEFGLIIKELAIKYKNDVVWSFKPHPILKSKLYKHLDWGKEKTDSYYTFWADNDFTQLEEGEYIDLFQQSSAMIHDSASFLYEYLVLKKPVMYLVSSITNNSLNEQGKRALEACYQASNYKEVEEFILQLINKKISIKKEHVSFFENNFKGLFIEKPSNKICDSIKNYLLGTVKNENQ